MQFDPLGQSNRISVSESKYVRTSSLVKILTQNQPTESGLSASTAISMVSPTEAWVSAGSIDIVNEADAQPSHNRATTADSVTTIHIVNFIPHNLSGLPAL
jgi:hypothetical protein